MKKFASLLIALLMMVSLSACVEDNRAMIVTTMFPQYDFAKQIVGDRMSVSLLIPPGFEVHNYEVTSRDMVAIKESRLFIFTSLEIDTWIDDAKTIGGDDTVVMDLSKAYTLIEHTHHEEEEHIEDAHDAHDHSNELHYWTDPTTAIQLIEAILEQIVLIDPNNEDFFRSNAALYVIEIETLHHALESLSMHEDYLGATLYFAGHNAMGAFGERYGLNIISLFDDFKPDADLTSDEIITFTEAVKSTNTKYLFIEELALPKAAQTIVNHLENKNYKLTLLELHGYHNVTQSDLKENVSYADLLSRNLEHIRTVLENSQL